MTDSATRARFAVELDFDAMIANPHPVYDRLRSEQPWAWSPQLNTWLVTRYDDVARVDNDVRFFSSVLDNDPTTRTRGRAMTRTDGTEHRRVRVSASPPLRRRTVEQEWSSVVAAHAARHVERVGARPSFDALDDFATPLMADILIDLLGLDGPTAEDIRRWSAAFVAGLSRDDDAALQAAVAEASGEVQSLVEAKAEQVSRAPDDSVISAMVAAGGDKVDLAEVGANVRLILSGGYNEPRDTIATLIWLLLSHPAERAVALESAEALDRAIDEAVRWLTPLAAAPRQVVEDVEIAGAPLRKGDKVLASFAAGNYDPRYFADPGRYRPDRPRLDEHMGFGLGTHFCLGRYLARQAMREAVPRLLALPGLTVDADLQLRGWRFRAPVAVPVRNPHPSGAEAGGAGRCVSTAVVDAAGTDAGASGVRLCALDEIPDGELLRVEIPGRPAVAVAVVDQDVLCIDDRCTHEDTSLSEGYLEDGCVECLIHGSRFDLRSGQPDAPPARLPVRTHQVTVVDGVVWLGEAGS